MDFIREKGAIKRIDDEFVSPWFPELNPLKRNIFVNQISCTDTKVRVAFMKPRHRNKLNIIYSLELVYLLRFTLFPRHEGIPIGSTFSVGLTVCPLTWLVLTLPLTSQCFANTIRIWGIGWPYDESEPRANFKSWLQSRPRLNIKTVFPGVGIPIIKMRRSSDRLIFIMGILYW